MRKSWHYINPVVKGSPYFLEAVTAAEGRWRTNSATNKAGQTSAGDDAGVSSLGDRLALR